MVIQLQIISYKLQLENVIWLAREIKINFAADQNDSLLGLSPIPISLDEGSRAGLTFNLVLLEHEGGLERTSTGDVL